MPKDEKRGLAYLRAAANRGFGRALNLLGDLAEGLMGGPSDYVAAERWYELASERRYPDAQRALSEIFGLNGVMTSMPSVHPKPDLAEAGKWKILSDSTGCHQGAPPDLTKELPGLLLPKRLSDGDSAKAAQLAAAWDSSHPPIDLREFDNDANTCTANASPRSFEDDWGKFADANIENGGMLCARQGDVELEASALACREPKLPLDAALQSAVAKSEQLIIGRSPVPISQHDLEVERIQTLDRRISEGQRITGPATCNDLALKQMRQTTTPEMIRSQIDALVQLPSTRLKELCTP